jgi:hypothetical protein
MTMFKGLDHYDETVPNIARESPPLTSEERAAIDAYLDRHGPRIIPPFVGALPEDFRPMSAAEAVAILRADGHVVRRNGLNLAQWSVDGAMLDSGAVIAKARRLAKVVA